MNILDIQFLMQSGIFQVLKMCAPVLGFALIVGLVVAILQATTSIQEQTLTFLPKFLTIFLVLFLMGGWMFTSTAQYFKRILELIPAFAK
ncbi:flagellar biosynthesis protein FliQ [Treponema sp.]|uniref:flagellar biosynthesis protein FliQ n=1 Tax=Treponema sp. TaxID=166 RepID=UPI00298DD9A1|nr:flagellar biosynthesis protein FliQ [Treponema sp.]MCQ2242010.1 flagellar biosynthesis protein FliQ [Treponema sp.]